MKPLLIDQFVTGLCSISEESFKIGTIYNYLTEHPVEKESLQPYLFFSKKFYTRNLIFKNDLFELMALCWDVGQCSRIHNHFDQNCWMSVPFGRLRIKDFKILEQNESTKLCRIEPAREYEIDNFHPAEVDPEEPIHQVSNPAEFKERAVSLHVYSKPFKKCLVYAPEKNQYSEVNLFYTSIEGKLCDGIKL